ncbi:hypothetical protein ADUPG1_006937 [Aduncisulcus paluster]|uniref:DDE Tnp4 domain-containing protein n=1 Tax=Aduncisulcus paluster TaxID=2918883 RepID=A0ABQ5KN18_9EUKA|nr:hypothetical protein ADUPG1_006937 [Aduncisulcus paluster]
MSFSGIIDNLDDEEELFDGVSGLTSDDLSEDDEDEFKNVKCRALRDRLDFDEVFKRSFGLSKDQCRLVFSFLIPLRDGPQRGARQKFTDEEQVLITLIKLRSGCDSRALATTLKTSDTTISRILGLTICIMEEKLGEEFITRPHSSSARHVPEAKLVVDGTIQKCSPFGCRTWDEKKKWYSHKHNAFGIKSEVITDVKGIARFVYAGFVGSIHDKTMFIEHADILREYLQGNAILGDMAYRGIDLEPYSVKVVISEHKSGLRGAERQRQKDISADRMIVEQFFQPEDGEDNKKG